MWLDILLVLLVAGAVLLAAVKILRDRRRGKSCCGSCTGCSSADECHSSTSNQKGRA